MNETLDHIERQCLPWRDGQGLTECGRTAGDVKSMLTLEEAQTKFRREGQQRAAYTTCMTCLTRARHARKWHDNPVEVVIREYGRDQYRNNYEDSVRELHAIALLIERHREEFDTTVAGLAATSSLDEVRAKRARRG